MAYTGLKRLPWLLSASAAGSLLFIFIFLTFRPVPISGIVSSPSGSTFVGSETCANCHRAEAVLWQSSQHKHAMDHATEKSVLGDFNNTHFDYYDVRSRFFRKDGKFFVETDGPDGKLATFEIKYTFGIDPLQQYLIEFPDRRIQALSIAWDARPKDEGGSAGFTFIRTRISATTIHCTGRSSTRTGTSCAPSVTRPACTRTTTRQTIATRPHGPKSVSVARRATDKARDHVAWAKSQQSWLPFNRRDDRNKGLLALFSERKGVTWSRDPRGGQLQRSLPPNLLRTEVEACGRCHARRSEISENWTPGRWLYETHAIQSPLARDVYWPDGQIRDVEEPYNYVPFKQSKMFAAGVTCSDCHNPHSGRQRLAGDSVCLQCHASETFSAEKHSHHEKTGAQPGCVSCHMPARTYMVVDRRHDHSLRIPRPDLSVKLGTPNACNDCHADKPAQWAADTVARWFGPDRKSFQNYGEAFEAGANDRADAANLLAIVAGDRSAPAVARASALIALAPYVSQEIVELARRGLSDPDPVVRIGAMDMLADVPPVRSWALISPLLSDPVRGVRIRAAYLLAAVPAEQQPQADRGRFESAAAEFVAAQQLNADRPEDRAILANFYARRGRTSDAEAEFKAALRLNPQYATAAINLADLYRALGRESESLTVLRDSLAAAPNVAALHQALGLALVRQGKSENAIDELRRATELAPDQPHFAYVYAVGLHSAGRIDEALRVLKTNVEKHPTDRDSLLALATFYRDAGNFAAALEYAKRLAAAAPGNRQIADFVDALARRRAN